MSCPVGLLNLHAMVYMYQNVTCFLCNGVCFKWMCSMLVEFLMRPTVCQQNARHLIPFLFCFWSAGELNFSIDDILIFGQAYRRQYGSPTELLLAEWGCKNPSITRFFKVLHKLGLKRPMVLLKDLGTVPFFIVYTCASSVTSCVKSV